ncbi:MAG: HipA domain-containing protein [Rhodobacteraceae bacterium]|nr:HipA domain-containing protein [Paracoccaceae bacterium]MYJ87615.1 type II toxin-antitoxin system HipA family toxin [Paracoccaceae bacterium]
MASLLWGKVYYHDLFVGYVREEPGDSISFNYDTSYIEGGYPAIAHTLPVRSEPYISNYGLHPFFDNLVSEGWLEQLQSRLLGRRIVSRFELLLAFGFDCAGAVSIYDPIPSNLSKSMLDMSSPKELAVLTSRASLSGVQPKLAVIEEDGIYRPTRMGELSTHIAKFPTPAHPDLIENEYLTTVAVKALIPKDEIVQLIIDEVLGLDESALLIRRFDRSSEGRLHFEEYNQLLNRRSQTKYDGSYKDMAKFLLDTKGCLPTQVYILYRRILAGLLMGNTDMHLKNFAMFHTKDGLRLTPIYDQIATSLYDYKTLALTTAGSKDHPIGYLKSRHLVLLGKEFGLSPAVINMAVMELAKNIEAAKDAINDTPIGAKKLRDKLIKLMDKRWNGTFSLIGKALSKKQ